MFAHLSEDGVAPSELARRLGHTRQATQELVQGLVQLDLVRMAHDPTRRGGRLVQLTDSGPRLALDAYGILMDLETELGSRRSSTLGDCWPISRTDRASTGSGPDSRVRAAGRRRRGRRRRG